MAESSSYPGWAQGRRDVLFDCMRIYLGIGLFLKGLQFLWNQDDLSRLLTDPTSGEIRFGFINTFLAHYIPLAHIGGGLLLAAGLMTRVSTLFQLPVLFGAVFFIYGPGGAIFTENQNFQFTALVLFLLILILLHGPGRLSVDYALSRSR